MKLTTFFVLIFFMVSAGAGAQNLYTQSNAANPTNEANSTTGWTGPANITSSTTNPQNGTYAIRVASTSTGGRDARYTFPATSGTVYNITIWARRGAQFNNPAFANWTGFSGFTTTTITSQNWTQYNFTVTATNNNPVIVAYSAPQGASAGNEIYLDNITITAQGGGGGGGDTEPPTAPSNLASSNVTSTSLTLTWTASTDNVGVTNYRIFRNGTYFNQTGNNSTTYNVTGLTASTAYSFYVVAQDAAGNNSNQSNTINVTTNSGGGGGGGGTGTPYTDLNANLPTVDWQANNFYAAGTVGIGTQPVTNWRLAVNGNIRAKEVVVESGWSDFVFDDDYELPPLEQVEAYIKANGHLKDIPSAAEVQANGVGLAEINTRLLQKIEELTLYIIDLNKQLQELKSKQTEGNNQ